MKKLLLTFKLICLFAVSFSQRGNNWQFGGFAGLDFNSGTPVPINSQMYQLEGSASISDMNGQLLFYSDGVKIWNKNNTVMPNGTGLWGHVSSSQSAMIVPFPADTNRYYIFTVDAQGGLHGLSYSVVNMMLDNGNGDVELKNVQLLTQACEKITSVNHCNGKDVWVISHQYNSDNINAYLITSVGVNVPVVSSTGVVGRTIGYLKTSPDGTRIVNANAYGGGLQLYDFNSSTGAVTNKREIYPSSPAYLGPYGMEFSSNSEVLYVSHCRPSSLVNWYFCELRQYSFLDSSVAKINFSKIVLDTDSTFFIPNHYSALQLGPDGKIYLSIYAKASLSVISRPNSPGLACNYIRNSQPLKPGTIALYGLPDFNQSYFKGSFSYDVACTNTTASFYYTKPNNATFVAWNFGDPNSGANNVSSIDSPVHIFSVPGIYTVRLITGLSCRNDTMVKIIKVDPLSVNLGSDTTVCNDSLLILSPKSGGNHNYLWQDNSTGPTLIASGGGWYWVEVTNSGNGCKLRDSLLLSRKPNPISQLGNDTIICERNDLLLNAGNSGAQYLWQDNSRNQTFLVQNAGQYFVKVNLNGCVSSDTILIEYKKIPTVYLGNDTVICPGMKITLNPYLQYAGQADYLWSTGNTTTSIQVTQPGAYSLEVRNNCGVVADAITVKAGVCQVYMPTAFTPNNDGKNDILKPGYGENVSDYLLEIYNRYGQKIFISNKIQSGWNGKYKGALQPAGIYVWHMRYTIFGDTKEYIQQGSVALLY